MSAPTLHPPDGYSLQDAASIIGVSLNTLRKRIASGQVNAERVQRPQGHVWRVYLDRPHPATLHADQDATLHAAAPSNRVQHPATPGMVQAEAMAAYTRSILVPLVESLERAQVRIGELENLNGRQSAELERAASTVIALSSELDTLKTAQTPVAPQPEPDPPSLAPTPTVPLWRRLWPLVLALLAVVLSIALLAWPR